jgi:ribosomal protein S18 acetylase RimI-like enzyme
MTDGTTSSRTRRLAGEETMVASWAALARLSAGAVVSTSSDLVTALFPVWAPLNNAIMLDPVDERSAARAAASASHVFQGAGVAAWALWVPSDARDFGATDVVGRVGRMKRDTTTLVMTAELDRAMSSHREVVPTSTMTAVAATDDPVSADDLDEPDAVPGLEAWVWVHDGNAVAGAWSFLHDGDCGVYTVGTPVGWRRRGFAHRLVEHVLADAAAQGARTASLQSTPMGESLYAGLGFRAVGRYEEWVAS